MLFSLIVVTLNSGDKLMETLKSALNQSFTDFEIIIKDGNSTDDSFEKASEYLKDERVQVYHMADHGIYEAMNQAVSLAKGEYLYFLNCGDYLYETDTLKKAAEGLLKYREQDKRAVLYGKIFNRKTNAFVTPSPVIDGFTCYRNVPCHQACFYARELCVKKPFETKYRIRGDYEQFLWCYYKGDAEFVYLEEVVASYEGGGYSETKENLKRSKAEHKEITQLYMEKKELRKYRRIMALTLAPVRTKLANSKVFSGIYNKLRDRVYRQNR